MGRAEQEGKRGSLKSDAESLIPRKEEEKSKLTFN